MRSKISFLHADFLFHVPKCILILKKEFTMLVTFSPISVADTKINVRL